MGPAQVSCGAVVILFLNRSRDVCLNQPQKSPWLARIFVIFARHAVTGCHCRCGRRRAGREHSRRASWHEALKTRGRRCTILILIVPDMKVSLGWTLMVIAVAALAISSIKEKKLRSWTTLNILTDWAHLVNNNYTLRRALPPPRCVIE